MTDDLHRQISNALHENCSGFGWSRYQTDEAATVVTDLIIDLAGRGELLKAIDRMYR